MRENPLMTLKDEISLDPGEVQRRVEWEAFELQRWCLKLSTENAQLNAHSCVALYRGWSDCGSVLLIEESVIPKDLKEEAQTFFEDMTVKLEWPDLYKQQRQHTECSTARVFILANPNHWLLLTLTSGFWRRAVFIDTQESTREAQEQNDRGL